MTDPHDRETYTQSLEARCDALAAERDAAFKMSRCECASDECCANLVKANRERDALAAENESLRTALLQIATCEWAGVKDRLHALKGFIRIARNALGLLR